MDTGPYQALTPSASEQTIYSATTAGGDVQDVNHEALSASLHKNETAKLTEHSSLLFSSGRRVANKPDCFYFSFRTKIFLALGIMVMLDPGIIYASKDDWQKFKITSYVALALLSLCLLSHLKEQCDFNVISEAAYQDKIASRQTRAVAVITLLMLLTTLTLTGLESWDSAFYSGIACGVLLMTTLCLHTNDLDNAHQDLRAEC